MPILMLVGVVSELPVYLLGLDAGRQNGLRTMEIGELMRVGCVPVLLNKIRSLSPRP